MNPVDEIKRRIESRQRQVAIVNAEIESKQRQVAIVTAEISGLHDALKVVEWADAIFIQHMMDVLGAIPQTGEVESGG